MENKENNQQYVQSLQNFSKSLQILVDSIKETVKEKNSVKDTFTTDTNEIYNNIITIAKDIEEIKVVTNTTQTNTVEILKEIKEIRQRKDKGILSKLSKAKDKTKSTAEGIKSIALMAGAILAIGSAFKVIGEVDFKSVLALSVALPILAISFDQVGQTSKSPKEAGLIALNMIIMSAGVAGSGTILSLMPSLTFGQMFSAVAVSIAIGISMYALSESVDNMGGVQNIAKMYKLIPILPLLAGSIALSGYALQNTPIISKNTFLSALGIGVSLGTSLITLAISSRLVGNNLKNVYGLLPVLPLLAGSLYLSAIVLQNLPNVSTTNLFTTAGIGLSLSTALIPLTIASRLVGNDVKKIYTLLPLLPLLAASIYASGFVLQYMPDINSKNVLEFATTIAGSSLIMGLGIMALNKLKIDKKSAINGGITIATLSGIIMTSSLILNAGNYNKYPSIDYMANVGLAIAGAGLLAYGANKLGLTNIVTGGIGIIGLAATIMATSMLLNQTTYDKYPSIDYMANVGLAISGAGLLSLGLSKIGLSNIVTGGIGIIGLAATIMATSMLLNQTTYDKYPSIQLTTDVGVGMLAFGVGAAGLGAIILGTGGFAVGALAAGAAGILGLAGSIIATAAILNAGEFNNYPSIQLTKGVSASMLAFAAGTAGVGLIGGVSNMLFGGGVKKIATSIMATSIILNNGKYTNYPTTQLSSGILNLFTTLSFINNLKIDKLSTNINYLKSFITDFNAIDLSTIDNKNIDAINNFINNFNLQKFNNNDDTILKMKTLAKVYLNLANSINTLSSSYKSIASAPDLTGIYGGIITLSLVDNNNLDKTLSTLNSKQSEFEKVMSMIRTQSDLKLDENTFAFNKDRKQVTKNNSNNNNNNSTVKNKQQQQITQLKTPAKPVKDDTNKKLNDNISVLIQINKQMISYLSSIADNTSKSLSDNNSMIQN